MYDRYILDVKMVERPEVRPDLPVTALVEAFGSTLEFNRDLAPLTSYKTGGRARYFLAAESAGEIIRAVRSAERLGLPFFLMGSGSNLLVSDDGYDGLVVRVSVGGMKLLSETEIECGAGEELKDLVDFATENGLSGLEFAAGIWGTVGGAVYGNAGAFGGEIGSILTSATLVDHDGRVHDVTPSELGFAYRHSVLKETHEVVVTTRFRLTPADRATVRSKVEEILQARSQRHPESGSAGCFFKNIPDPTQEHGKLPAGRLLEQVGAKQMRVGGARVYEKHANIIVNSGNATSTDIRRLADILKQKVREQFGIELQEEVQQLGHFPSERKSIE